MSETRNPFEQAESMSASGFDPFAQSAADPFGAAPPAGIVPDAVSAPAQDAPPSIDLGNQPTANAPFETPAAQPAGTLSAPTPAVPVIDLGSQPGAAVPFPVGEQAAPPTKENEGGQIQMFGAGSESEPAQKEADVPVNPIEAAMAEQEKTEQQSIFAKPPIFEHGAVKEPIENLDQTFEDLRVAKSDDFPELEDAVRVSWNVTYGKISKSVTIPKKTKIGEFKKQIESSKDFLDALKKDKDKSPDCIIKPRITAQSKGEQRDAAPMLRCGGETKEFSSYKALFLNLDEAEKSGKVICLVPGSDGKVYEIRNEEAGTFTTPSGECRELSEIKAGFTPALPLIPNSELRRILGFFRSVMRDGHNYEAIANIYWYREREEYRVVVPRQHVSSVRAESDLSDDYDPGRFLHYMDIHSHNVMPARFSRQDDADEKATRLYAVIGKLNDFIPELSVRISNGGKYLAIDPSTVFESFGDYYPVEWNDQVTFDACNYELPEDSETIKLQCLLRSFGRKGLMCA